jgi:hypothetical protein
MRCALKNNWARTPVLLAVAYSEKRADQLAIGVNTRMRFKVG